MFKYIEINPFVYIIAIISIFTATFIDFIVISSLIIIHELGHFIVAKFLKVEVDKIYLYPLGGISKFNLHLNSSAIKELIILIAGPIFQNIAYINLIMIFPENYSLIKMYHYGILIFNLLPIYPLDGGKIINIFLSLFLSFKKSFLLTINISYIVTFLYFILNLKTLKINTIIVILFLIFKIKNESDKLEQIYEKFLLERYLYNYKYKRKKIIDNQQSFYKYTTHLINESSNYYLEKDYLEKKYKKSEKNVDNKNSLC